MCSTPVERDYNRHLELQADQNEAYQKRTSRADYAFDNSRRECHRSRASVSPRHHIDVNDKLTTMISWQMAAVRHERLKNLKALEGYEGTGKLKEFFRRFEEMTLGCDENERISLLREEGIQRHPKESLACYSDRVAKEVRLAFAGSDKQSTERFLNYYFLKGLNDQILASSISALQGLTFEEKVAQAVTMEATLIATQPQHNRAQPRTQTSSYATPRRSITSQRQPPQRAVSFQQSFCSHCQIPGHVVSECGKLRNQNSTPRQPHNFGTSQQEHRFTPMTAQANSGGTANVHQGRCTNQISAKPSTVVKKSPAETPEHPGFVPTLVLMVNGQLCRGLVDTGASVTVLSQGCWSKVASTDDKLRPLETPCLASNGLPMKIIGEVTVPVQYKDKKPLKTRIVVAADTFGHDLIIGTDLLDRLHFELYNREDKEHLSIPSLSLLPPNRRQRRQNEPVRVLHTTTLPPHSKKLVSVAFPPENGQIYVLEHTDTLNGTVDTDPALVGPMSKTSQPWTVYNTSDKAIRLEEGAILGYAAQIEKIYGEEGPHTTQPTAAHDTHSVSC
ncbi:hypothetical protein QR680_009306 [Steinernema hermaphroditum]|uniref:Peptidase A2 domain-containing protein n=1 Tax=Steinernema hermaphroditum TaxID=289476 RepID=A0AA39M9N5_9BILA|nr:hypothetical protein QR680_009306 [Steinernema hermaphroditum]